jgi:hypothetical protein
MRYDQKLGWVHINCVNWIPDVWFVDEDRTYVDGTVNTERFKLSC